MRCRDRLVKPGQEARSVTWQTEDEGVDGSGNKGGSKARRDLGSRWCPWNSLSAGEEKGGVQSNSGEGHMGAFPETGRGEIQNPVQAIILAGTPLKEFPAIRG